MKKIALTLILTSIIITLGAKPTVSQSQDVKPYEFASIDVAFHSSPVKLYKVLYQGCEIFVATNGAMGKEAASIAMATGRGCK